MKQFLQTPLNERKHRVETLARFGAEADEIAAELQIPLKRLQKRFRRELERGDAKGKHEILEELFKIAKSGSNVGATAMWVKSRCGWRDTGKPPAPRFIHAIMTVRTTDKAEPAPTQAQPTTNRQHQVPHNVERLS